MVNSQWPLFANTLLEDESIESSCLSLLDSRPYGTSVGIYDGHGGPETSRYVNDHLFHNLKIANCWIFFAGWGDRGGTLYIANLGDSRAFGKACPVIGEVLAIQIFERA
ncbi:putative protein phosphatase 2C 46 [Camellia lanceoleosa]|uniref:Uncharacterized protein n=1 Tax=Camellia lanceoleosa TaxID=1840588 RepID=A0ACC0IVM5_9ERIC|nr:putative protein phosphatase 2C 46 [Camellia lanceoleosa]